jgi:hypothetical protein
MTRNSLEGRRKEDAAPLLRRFCGIFIRKNLWKWKFSSAMLLFAELFLRKLPEVTAELEMGCFRAGLFRIEGSTKPTFQQ